MIVKYDDEKLRRETVTEYDIPPTDITRVSAWWLVLFVPFGTFLLLCFFAAMITR